MRRTAAPNWLWRLPLAVVLALRGVRSARRDAFSSFLAATAIGGIGVGVAALVVALAALAGLQEALTGEILERTPHLEVGVGAADPAVIEAQLAQIAGVELVQPLIRGRGWLLVGDGVEPVEVTGAGGGIPRSFPRPTSDRPGLYVPDHVAVRWGLELDQPVRAVGPKPTLGPLGPVPRTREVRYAGSFEGGRTEEVIRILVPLEVARGLFGAEAARFEVSTTSLDQALVVAERIRAAEPGVEVATWRDLNRPLFFALRLEKTVLFLAVGLVVVVAALGLVAELALLVATRREEIRTLLALGAARATLRKAFVGLGLLVAAVAALGGGAIGVAAALVLDRTEVVALSSSAFFLDHVPFRIEAGDVGAILGLTMVLALGSGLWVTRAGALEGGAP